MRFPGTGSKSPSVDLRKVAAAALAAALDDLSDSNRRNGGAGEHRKGMGAVKAVAAGAVLVTAGKAAYKGLQEARERLVDDEPEEDEELEDDEEFEDEEPLAEEDEDFEDEDEEEPEPDEEPAAEEDAEPVEEARPPALLRASGRGVARNRRTARATPADQPPKPPSEEKSKKRAKANRG